AFFYNLFGIPLAAGAFVPLLGWSLDPSFCAAAMGLSGFCVVMWSLRLNRVRLFSDKLPVVKKSLRSYPPLWDFLNQYEGEPSVREGKTMVLSVKGMMCPHCEQHVKEALEKLPFVSEAKADRETATVTLTTKGEADEGLLQKTVEDAGYQYFGIVRF
ncbi:MAG: cation transporter, partial [Clostridia bacterium]|nr:cation transporter [Clostridia bacterium]